MSEHALVLRQAWRAAAWTLAGQGDLRAAGEALRNGLRRHPPVRWSTGVALLHLAMVAEGTSTKTLMRCERCGAIEVRSGA